jgi:hypothetical protein
MSHSSNPTPYELGKLVTMLQACRECDVVIIFHHSSEDFAFAKGEEHAEVIGNLVQRGDADAAVRMLKGQKRGTFFTNVDPEELAGLLVELGTVLADGPITAERVSLVLDKPEGIA